MDGAIELVVFDMDGVLAELDRALRLRLLAGMTGKEPAFLQAAIWDSDFEPGAELGAYATGAEYLAEFNRRTGAALSREQWVRARRDATRVRNETLRIAQALCGECGIALLTNNGALLLEALSEILPDVHRVFGARAHASCQFKARKPEPRVFERLLARYGVLPARAVFVDDDEAFVAGAREAGLHGIPYRGPAELEQRLRALGLKL